MDVELKTLLIESFEDEALEMISESEWAQEYKRQHRTCVCFYEGKYYEFRESRTGSPFTDWHYDKTEVREVVSRVELVPFTFWDPVT